MFATDEETILQEFLDEAVPCETYTDSKPEHEAEVYVKAVCPHCENTVLWPTCRPCWVYVLTLLEDLKYSCKTCKRSVRLTDNVYEVGPVR